MLANLEVDLTQTADEAHKDMVAGNLASKANFISKKQTSVQHEPLGLAQANIETREQRIKEAIAAEKKAEKKAVQLQKLFQNAKTKEEKQKA